MHKQVYEYLQDVAKRRECTTCAEVARLGHLNVQEGRDLAKLGEILTEISIHERDWVGRCSVCGFVRSGEECTRRSSVLAREWG